MHEHMHTHIQRLFNLTTNYTSEWDNMLHISKCKKHRKAAQEKLASVKEIQCLKTTNS